METVNTDKVVLSDGFFPYTTTEVRTVSDLADMSSNINEIAAALAKAQSELEAAKKGEEGYGYKYSDLATVIASAKPVLAKNNLAVVQLVGKTDKEVSVTTILTHSSGQFFRSNATLPLIDMKGCNAAQNAGASLSYLRRYTYQAIIGQPSEDNDANSAGFKKETKSKAPTERKKVDVPKKSTGGFRKKKAANDDI